MSNEFSGAAHTVIQASHIGGGVSVGLGAAVAPEIPRQLPPQVRLIDRSAEQEVLRGVILGGDGQSPVAVVSGQSGVGKTTLAVQVAHACADRFPDGQLYADLAGVSPDGTQRTLDVLGHFLRCLGVPSEDVPAAFADRAARFRSRMADKKLLVVLDNATSADQIRPLIPASPQCAVVVTSKNRLDGLVMHGARFLELDCLGREHAVDLLAAIAGRRRVDAELDAAGEIAARCAGLPLALVVAGAVVATRRSSSLTALANNLTSRLSVLDLSVEGGTGAVQKVIDMSYENLPDLAQCVHRVMALHPAGAWSVEVAAAALDEPVGEVEQAVRELITANLVTENADGSLTFHDLVRQHGRREAHKQLTGQERDTAVRRMAEFYRDRSVAADLVLRPIQDKFGPAYESVLAGVWTAEEAMEWFRRHRDPILAILRIAANRDWGDLAWTLSEPLWTLLHHDGFHQAALETQELGELDARRHGHVFEAIALVRQGHLLRNLGRLDEARARCTQALDLAAHEDTWALRGRLWIESAGHHGRGRAAHAAGDIEAARQDFARSYRIERDLTEADPDNPGYGLALRVRDVAWLEADCGNFTQAYQYIEDAEQRMRTVRDRTGDARGYGRTRQLRGRIYHLQGEFPRARQAFTDAEAALRHSGAHRWLVELYQDIAQVEDALGARVSAARYLTAALEIATGDDQQDTANKLLAQIVALRAQALNDTAGDDADHD